MAPKTREQLADLALIERAKLIGGKAVGLRNFELQVRRGDR